MMIKNTASVSSFTVKAGNASDKQKDSVKTVVRTENDGKNTKLQIVVKIVEDMFPDYCQGNICRNDILDKLMDSAGLTESRAGKYFNDIQKQILQDEL